MVLASEAFRSLLAVTLRARHVPAAFGIVIRGNPEMRAAVALDALADALLDEAVLRLTTGRGAAGELVG